MSRDEDNWFTIGSGRVIIAPDNVIFVNDVVGDFARLAHSAEGEAVLTRGDTGGYKVKITQPDPPTEPPNGWVVPDDIVSATNGGPGCGSTIVYDPADWPRRGDPRSPTSAEVLLRLLRQANLNATGQANLALPDWGDKV